MGVSPFWSTHDSSMSTMRLSGPLRTKEAPVAPAAEARDCQKELDDSFGGAFDTAATRVAPTDVSEKTWGRAPEFAPLGEVYSRDTVTGERSWGMGPHNETRCNRMALIMA